MLNIDAPDLQQIASVLSGEMRGENQSFQGVVIDSRILSPGNLFVAIRGPRFDGHDFLDTVKSAGAVAAIVEEFVAADLPQIKVASTMEALSLLAKVWRDQVDIPVVGITGSNGKTTVKEMTAAILSEASEGLKTSGNFNNDIGVPLTLLELRSKHDWAVIEMGASHVGEIAQLAEVARPTVAMVNNISKAHIEGFGSEKDTALTKGAIFSNLGDSGVAVMPEGSEYVPLWQEQSSAGKTLTFGDNAAADIWFESQQQKVKMNTPHGAVYVDMRLAGEHNCHNAAAATSVALACGASLQQVKSGLEHMGAVTGRLEEKQGATGERLIDDTYNANPTSVKAAIDYLVTQAEHTVLVLGDMGELGEEAQAEHAAVGQYAASQGVSTLLSVGKLSKHSSDAFTGEAKHFSNHDAAVASLKNVVTKNTVVLVKGSRFMQMEKVVAGLMGDDSR